MEQTAIRFGPAAGQGNKLRRKIKLPERKYKNLNVIES
jgi:hypothetical protein